MMQETAATASVVIGITTYQRPQMLEDALRAVEALDVGANVISVLVADNDAAGQGGVRVAERLAHAGYCFPIATLVIETRGFTYGRNAILEEAFRCGASFVAMMDDDQLPDAGWLTEMLKMQRESGADVVGPAVWPLFESEAPSWAENSRIYHRDTQTSGPVDRLYGDGGVLFSTAAFENLAPPYYDHFFALTGGADADLFERMKRLGVTFARAAPAKINERYPASRITLSWALQRAFRLGNVDVLIRMKSEGRYRTALGETLRIAGALLVTPVSLLASIGRSGAAVDALCRAARAFGKIAALLGSAYQEYAIIHGR